jgi:hypothetical protein
MKRITQITVVPDGEPIFSERAVTISIRDEAAGEFVVVKQLTDDPQELSIDPEEWPALREAIDEMIKECREVVG